MTVRLAIAPAVRIGEAGGAMRATVRNDTTERVITLEVSGTPDLDVTESWHHKDRTIRPDHLEITMVDEEFRQAVVSGPMVKATGEPGLVRVSWRYAHPDARYERHTLDKAPEWVQRLVREAPAGVLTWGEPEPRPVQITEHSSGALILDVD
jgi:hypothetical protein